MIESSRVRLSGVDTYYGTFSLMERTLPAILTTNINIARTSHLRHRLIRHRSDSVDDASTVLRCSLNKE